MIAVSRSIIIVIIVSACDSTKCIKHQFVAIFTRVIRYKLKQYQWCGCHRINNPYNDNDNNYDDDNNDDVDDNNNSDDEDNNNSDTNSDINNKNVNMNVNVNDSAIYQKVVLSLWYIAPTSNVLLGLV